MKSRDIRAEISDLCYLYKQAENLRVRNNAINRLMSLIDEQIAIKLTSEDWNKLLPDSFTILDPDGWDRTNWDYSWRQERITANEFGRRTMMSTIQVMLNEYPIDDLVKKYGVAQLSPKPKEREAV